MLVCALIVQASLAVPTEAERAWRPRAVRLDGYSRNISFAVAVEPRAADAAVFSGAGGDVFLLERPAGKESELALARDEWPYTWSTSGVVLDLALAPDFAYAAAFRDGSFRTGDMAYRDAEGFVYLVDRRKDMIRSGGENVYSIEVERVLEAHPGVAEVAVVPVSDPLWVETVGAVVVARPGHDLRAEDVQAWCRMRGQEYAGSRIAEDGVPVHAVRRLS